MGESFQVKGSALTTKLAFLRSQGGNAMAVEAEAFLADHGIPTVLESIWYPYSTYDALLRWVADRCFGSDLKRLEQVGRFSAEAAHTSTYKGFVGSGDFQRYLEQLSVLHGRIYSLGSVLVSPGGDSRSCTVRIVKSCPSDSANPRRRVSRSPRCISYEASIPAPLACTGSKGSGVTRPSRPTVPPSSCVGSRGPCSASSAVYRTPRSPRTRSDGPKSPMHHRIGDQLSQAPEVEGGGEVDLASAAGVRAVSFAVGTPVSRRPPRRSQRAALPHWAPALGQRARRCSGQGWMMRGRGRKRRAIRSICFQVTCALWLRRLSPRRHMHTTWFWKVLSDSKLRGTA